MPLDQLEIPLISGSLPPFHTYCLLSKADAYHMTSPTDLWIYGLWLYLYCKHTDRFCLQLWPKQAAHWFKLHLYRLCFDSFKVTHWIGIVRHVVIIWGGKVCSASFSVVCLCLCASHYRFHLVTLAIWPRLHPIHSFVCIVCVTRGYCLFVKGL